MNESYANISAAIKELEQELARRQQALELLRQALKLVEGVEAALPGVPAGGKDGLAQHVDRYIASLQDGDGFTVEDVVEAVAASGMEPSDSLRSKVTSILGRRVKSKSIERVGERGSYAKPDKVY